MERKWGLVDDLDIGKDGKIYFTDASWKFPFSKGGYRNDLLEHGPNGSLYMYDPATKQTHLLLDSLSFANGVALGPNDAYVLVTETGAYKVVKYWLAGPKKGTTEVFLDNLPGFPDNINFSESGIFWLAFANPRNSTLDKLLPYPFLRKIVYRLPEFVQPTEVRYGFMLGIDLQGNIIHNFQDPGGELAPVTSVTEWRDQLYLGSLSDDAFGIIDKPDSPHP